jgi:multicomponent K+:H+ antiporter subunit G
MVCFSGLDSRPVLHEILIGVFITITTPVTLMLLARAALYRERAEGSPDAPARSILRPPYRRGEPRGAAGEAAAARPDGR